MTIGQFEVIEHTETVKAERFVVFVRKNNRLERAPHLGKRGGFKTWRAAVDAATHCHRFGTANV
jgi:hypothetical protein